MPCPQHVPEYVMSSSGAMRANIGLSPTDTLDPGRLTTLTRASSPSSLEVRWPSRSSRLQTWCLNGRRTSYIAIAFSADVSGGYTPRIIQTNVSRSVSFAMASTPASSFLLQKRQNPISCSRHPVGALVSSPSGCSTSSSPNDVLHPRLHTHASV